MGNAASLSQRSQGYSGGNKLPDRDQRGMIHRRQRSQSRHTMKISEKLAGIDRSSGSGSSYGGGGVQDDRDGALRSGYV